MFLDKANSGLMYLIVGVPILFVIIMSVVFMVKAWREGKRVNIDREKMKKAVLASAAFTLVPSIGILIGVIALSGSLGIPVPWLRLTVIGALHYETMAADVAAKAAGLASLSAELMTPDIFVSVITVMTVGIISGAIFSIFGLKKYQSKVLGRVNKKDDNWGQIMFTAMFIGMVCAFIGTGFADLRRGSFTSLIVIVVSALVMALFTWLSRLKGLKWLESFSLSFAMFAGMGSAILVNILGVA